MPSLFRNLVTGKRKDRDNFWYYDERTTTELHFRTPKGAIAGRELGGSEHKSTKIQIMRPGNFLKHRGLRRGPVPPLRRLQFRPE